MGEKHGLSIKFKLLVLLMTLPILTLAAYLVMAITKFKDDKRSYVQGAALAHAQVMTAQFRASMASLEASLKPIVEGFSPDQKTFDATASNLFRNDKIIQFLSLFSEATQTTPLTTLSKFEGNSTKLEESLTIAKRLAGDVSSYGFAVYFSSSKDMYIGIKWRILGQQYCVIGQMVQEEIQHTFQDKNFYSSTLVDPSGKIVLSPNELSIENISNWEFFKTLQASSQPEGVRETVGPQGNIVIASFKKVGRGDLVVLATVDKAATLRAVEQLLKESIAFFVALISLMTLISVLAARKLTRSLQTLAMATRKVAQGDFNIQVEVETSDEVGSLAYGFNRMAEEVSRLMKVTADQARMEKELETAKTVQETLFPPMSHSSENFQISGFYEPASECGGDWWHYCEIGSKLYLWIGDATGHGAPAALVTSAAKSAASIVEKLGPLPPEKILELMNKAIHETSKGKILMTFFVAALDRTTGELTYANASHDPPYILKAISQPLKKKDLLLLNEVNGPRLGQSASATYAQTSVKLNKGDRILFYTDGVVDIQNEKLEAWGEREFVKSVLSAANKSPNCDHFVKNIVLDFQSHRGRAPLKDDVTFFFIRYQEGKAA